MDIFQDFASKIFRILLRNAFGFCFEFSLNFTSKLSRISFSNLPGFHFETFQNFTLKSSSISLRNCVGFRFEIFPDFSSKFSRILIWNFSEILSKINIEMIEVLLINLINHFSAFRFNFSIPPLIFSWFGFEIIQNNTSKSFRISFHLI